MTRVATATSLATRPTSITHHVLWPDVAELLVVEPAEGGRVRLEIKRVSGLAMQWLLMLEVACAACGRTINPARVRKPPENSRSKSVGHGLYLAVACPLEVRIGCSRGKRARDEYLRIQRALLAEAAS